MFNDQRSKRVILAAHCVLNQNAKIDRCAFYPGVMREVTLAILQAGVGFVQMPCPELMCLGLDRQARADHPGTVASEDTRVADCMAGGAAQRVCRQLAADLVYQIEQYRCNGFEVIGVLGINGSPTCGVEISWRADQEQSEPGVFIGLLQEACRQKGIELPFRGIRAAEPQQAL
ncbi:MAG: CD3072 family TudS-related putative desulfidase, partial [Anaerolineaceae bacterium]